jgi:hypothetical protein
MDCEQIRDWKQTVVIKFNMISQHPGENEENHKHCIRTLKLPNIVLGSYRCTRLLGVTCYVRVHIFYLDFILQVHES